MDRRRMIKASLAGTLGVPAVVPMLGAAGRSSRPFGSRRNESAAMQDAVRSGVDYFKMRCDQQMPTVIAMREVIGTGNVEAAKTAYIEARPPYEEIETIAGSFEDSDRDIDARPYAFDGGETDPEFRGFHKIENLIFAEEDLQAAKPYADTLVMSIRQLRKELDEPSRFSPEGQFDGMIALTNEVAAKKISSEEETWSDQTLLIFKHNWIGVYSQFKPFGNVVGGNNANVKAVDDAYRSAMATLTPHFTEGKVAATPYSQISNKERRSMADASNRFRDSIIVIRDDIGLSG